MTKHRPDCAVSGTFDVCECAEARIAELAQDVAAYRVANTQLHRRAQINEGAAPRLKHQVGRMQKHYDWQIRCRRNELQIWRQRHKDLIAQLRGAGITPEWKDGTPLPGMVAAIIAERDQAKAENFRAAFEKAMASQRQSTGEG